MSDNWSCHPGRSRLVLFTVVRPPSTDVVMHKLGVAGKGVTDSRRAQTAVLRKRCFYIESLTAIDSRSGGDQVAGLSPPPSSD